MLAIAGYVTWTVTPAAERAELAAELASLADRLGDPMVAFQAAVAGYYAACEQPDLDAAERRLAEMTRFADELGQPLLRWRTTYMAGVHASAIGGFDTLAHLAEESLRLGEAAGQPDAYAHSRGPLSISYLMRARPVQAAEIQRELVDRFPGITTFRALLAWSTAAAGDAAEARRLVAGIRAEGFGGIARDYTWGMTLVWLSNAVACLGEQTWAAELHALLDGRGTDIVVGATVWVGPVSHSLGLLAATLGHLEEAATHFAEAATLQQRVGARGTLIHTNLAWSRVLSRRGRRGDGDDARALASAAAEAARDLGYPDLERLALAERGGQ